MDSGNTRSGLLRVLVSHNRYLQAGGEDGVFADEVEMLRQRGHEVHTLEVNNQQMVEMSTPRAALTTVWNRRMSKEVSRRIAEFQPDVMHVHNDFPYASPSIYYAAAARGVPVVLTLHNFRGMCANGVFFRDGKVCRDCVGRPLSIPAIRHRCYRDNRPATLAVSSRRLAHLLLGTWQKKVAAYIAPTHCVRDQYTAGGYPADRIFVKPHFVTGDPKAGPGGGGYVVFIGRLTPAKGIGNLLELWRGMPGTWRLKIIGDGECRPDVEAAAADAARRIDYLGTLTPAGVHQCLAKAEAAVVPSVMHESFCRVVAEAFAAGTPVIATNHAGPGELVAHGQTGLLYDTAQPQGLRETLLQAQAHPATLRNMRTSCRQTFESRFTQDANYPQLLAIYRRAIGNTDAARSSAVPVDPAPQPA